MLSARISVSIPHRYDPNFRLIVSIPQLTVFQFLIGTIQTEGYSKEVFATLKFQFLIGTIQT